MNHTATVHVELDAMRTYFKRGQPVWKATLVAANDEDIEGPPNYMERVSYAGPNPGDAVNRLLDGFFDP